MDEAFVDMSGTEGLWGGAGRAAERIRDQIRDTLGFTVNIGIAENKLLAKMASDFQKPDRVHTLWKEEIQEKMWGLPVSDLFFVGRATAKRLFHLGIRTVGELAHADPELLKRQSEKAWRGDLGVRKRVWMSRSCSAEPPANKGYGNSTTIAFDVTDASVAKLVLSLRLQRL